MVTWVRHNLESNNDIILIDSSRDDDSLAKFRCSATVKIANNAQYLEVFRWLENHFPNQFISSRVNSKKPFKFLFTEEKYLTMFIVKWC